MAVHTDGNFRVFWMLGVLTCCLFTNTNGQEGVSSLQIDSTTSFGFEISWSAGAWDYYVITAYLGSGEEAPGYPMNSTSTSAQLIHLYPDTAYDIQVQPKLNNGEEGQLDTRSGTTDVSRIEVTVRSETFISVAYTLPEDEPSSNQQIRLGHFGSTLQTSGNQPVNNMGSIIFNSFPAVSPGDLLYASNAPSSDLTNYLNEIHFRYPSSPPQNVMVNPSPGDAFEVTFDLPATGGNYDGFKIRVNDEVRETLMGSATTSVIINSLAPNTLYTFNVTSFVGIGGDEAESEIFTDTRILGSSMPDITVLNTTESSIALGLQPGHGVLDEYIITIQCMDATQDHCVCEEEHRVPGNAKTFVIDDLRPNVEYGISVVAWAGSELAETSEEVTLEQRTLSIPNNRFTVLDQTPDSVILAWTVSGPANITMERLMPSGYVLNATYVYDGCFSSNVLEVSGLEPVTIYRFTMPDDVSILIRTDPPSIESCSVETTSSGYTFTWSALAPGSNDGYQVTVTDSQGGLVQEEAVPPTDNPEVVKIRVPPETELTLAVISRLAADDTNNFPQQFGAVPCIQNAVTMNFNLILREETVLGLSWGQPVGTDYDSLRLEASFGLNSRNVDLPAESLAFNLTQLTPGTEHTVSLYKKMGEDRGDLVTRNTFQTLPATLDASTITFSVKENGDLVSNWRVPLGVVDYYEVTVTPGDLVLNITANTYTFTTSLVPSTTYTFSIKTFTGGFESTGTATENRLTGPAAPGGIEITAYSTGADIDWTDVPDAEMYRVILKNSSGSTLSDDMYDGPPFEPQDLEEATAYSVSITSIDTNGIAGEQLTGRTSTMPFTTITRFAEVTSRTGDSITLGSLTAGDEASAEGGGSVLADVLGNAVIFGLSPARCYRIEVARSLALIDFFEECTLPDPPSVTVQRGSPTDSLLLLNITAPSSSSELVTYAVTGGGSDVPQTVTDISSSISFSGLEPYTNYTFTVVSVFMNLESSEVTESESTALSSPSNFEATLTTYTEITLEWTAVPNAAIYILRRTPGDDQVMTNQPSHTFTGLRSSRVYSFSIISSRAGDFDSEEVTIDASAEEIPAGLLVVTDVTSEGARIQWGTYDGVTFYSITFDPVDAVIPNNGALVPDINIEIHTPGNIINVTLGDLLNSVDVLAFTQLRSGPGSPIGPLNISGSVLTANITWISPASPHDGFEVYITNLDLPSGERILKETLSNNPGFYIVTGLIPGTTFEIEVGTYLDPVGMFPLQRSEQSINLRNNITTDAPEREEILLVDCGTDYIQVAWGVSSYTYDHSIEPTHEGTEMDLDMVNGLVTYRGLQPGTQYTIFITNSSVGVSLNVSSFTVPLPPNGLAMLSATYDQIVLSWDESSGQGIEYEIVATSKACGGISLPVMNTSDLNITLTDLRIATNFTISVVAVANEEKKSDPAVITVSTDSNGVVDGRVTVIPSRDIGDDQQEILALYLFDTEFTFTSLSISTSGSCEDSSFITWILTRGIIVGFNVTSPFGHPFTEYRTDPQILNSVSLSKTMETSTQFSWTDPSTGSYDGVILVVTSLQDQEYSPPGQQLRTFNPLVQYTLEALKPSTSYNVRVKALSNATARFEEQFGPEERISFTTLSLPASEVFILEMGNSSVELIHGGNGSSFNFSINPDHAVIVPGDNNRVAFTNLMPGTVYNVSIYVVDEDLESSFLLRLPPLTPMVAVRDTTETTITLDIVAGPGDAETYAIRIASTNPDFCSYEDIRNIEFFKSGDYVIDNLPPSLMYNIEVRSEVAAIDDVWLEAYSPGVNLSASTELVPLDGFTVINRGEESVNLAWFSNTTSNLTLTSWSRDQSVTETLLSETDCSSPRIMEIDLNRTGTVYIIAYNPDSSEGFNYTTRTDPAAVMDLNVTSANQTSIEVTGKLPSVGDVDRVELTLTSPEDGRYTTPVETASVIEEGYLFTNLLPNTLYYISVRSVLNSTDEFEEQKSRPYNITKRTDVPVSPMIFEIDRNETAIVYSIGAFDDSDVTLSPNGDWMSSYETDHTVFITNLLPGQLYNGTISTAEILPIQFRLRPSMPEITVLNMTESSIALGLQPGNGILDEYIITIQCMDATQDHCVCEEEHRVPGNAKTFVIDDLRPSVEYRISVVAWAGSELAETSVEVTLEVTTLGIPDGRFTVLDQTPDSVILAWTVSGPANITMERLMPSGYVLNATYVYDGCFSSNVLEVSGLEPVTIYRFTMPDDVSILIRTDPPSIENCSVETTSSGYTFTWSALAPGSNDGYQVTVTDSQGDLVQEEAVPPTDDPEVVKIRVPPETELTLAVNSWLAADDTDNFPQQFGAVPCIQNAVTKSLEAGEVSPTNVTVNEIPFVVGNASALEGFEAYAFAVGGRFCFAEDWRSRRRDPETPQPPILTSVGPFSLSFEWAPTNTTFSSYRMYYAPFSFRRELISTIPNNSSDLTYSQGCLRPNTEYVFEVETVLDAADGFGEQTSDSAQSISITTRQYDNNEPHVSSTNNTNLQVIWLDAATNGQQVCLKELCSTLRGDTPMCLPTNQTCPLFYTFEGLVPGRRYVVYVEYNDGTMEDVIFTQTKPNPPESLNATALGSDEIRVLLSPPQGEFDGYELSFSPNSAGGPILLEPDTREHLLYNLPKLYYLQHPGEGEENEVNIRDLTSTSVSFTWWGTGSVESPIGLMPIGSCMAEEPPEQEVTSRAATFDDLMPGARYAISGIGGDNAEFIAVPDQVSNIVVKFINSSAVTFSWTAPSGCYDRIEISYAPDTCTNPSPIVLNHDEGNEYTLTLLQANEEYQLSFVTLQMTARSEPYVASVRTTCPEKEKLNVGSVQADSISLTWGNTTQATATGFTLVATPESSTPIIRELDLSVLEYTFDGLMSGVEYTVVLYVNGTAITDSVTQTTCPSEAQNVTVIFSTQTCLTFAWLPPEGNFHSYEVFVRHGNPPVFVLERTVYPDDDLNVLVENLDASTLYTIGVVTVVDGFKGMPALAIQRTTDNLVMTSTVAGDSQAVTVSWQRPDGADYFNLVYIPDNGDMANSDLTNLTDLSVTIGSLTPGKRYVFILSVHDMDGQSALLAQTSYTLRPERPLILDVMSSVTIAAMAVTAQEGVYETYKISISPSGRTFQGDRAALIFQYISGLEPDTDYIATVTFKTGDEEAEADYEFETNPLRMDQLYSDEVTTDSIGLVWEVIPDTDTYAIQLDDRLFFTLETSYVLTGLKAGTEYSPTLLVRKTGMTELDNVDTTAIYTLPEPVLFFEVKEIIDNNVTFVWSGPSSDFDRYGLAIAPPIVDYRISLDEKEITIQVNTNKEFLASIYTYAGPWSSEPSTLNVIIDPREPGTINVEEVTSTSISITWTEIAGITDYIVNLNLASNNTELFSGVIRNSLKASFSGLMPGEEYIIEIELQCAGEVLSLRQFTLPLAPVRVVFTWVTIDSVTLQWSRPESKLVGYEIMYDDGSGPYSPINVFDRISLQLERTIMGLMDGPGVEVNITTLAGAGMGQTRSNSVKISPSE
eukprot:XP_011671266.1 PREDICTED: uncharacterized protein LOC100889066 [Strongylocentrotus purpuratus]